MTWVETPILTPVLVQAAGLFIFLQPSLFKHRMDVAQVALSLKERLKLRIWRSNHHGLPCQLLIIIARGQLSAEIRQEARHLTP